jgi:hypothetical protein
MICFLAWDSQGGKHFGICGRDYQEFPKRQGPHNGCAQLLPQLMFTILSAKL